MIGQTFCLSHPSRPSRFVPATRVPVNPFSASFGTTVHVNPQSTRDKVAAHLCLHELQQLLLSGLLCCPTLHTGVTVDVRANIWSCIRLGGQQCF